MNECPFCGGTLDCINKDVWKCENCHEVWLRAAALNFPKSEIVREIFKLTFKTLNKER